MKHYCFTIALASMLLSCSKPSVEYAEQKDTGAPVNYISLLNSNTSDLLNLRVGEFSLNADIKTKWGISISSNYPTHVVTNGFTPLPLPLSDKITFNLVENNIYIPSADSGAPQVTLAIKTNKPYYRRTFFIPAGYSLRKVESTSLTDAKEWKYSIEFGCDDPPTMPPISVKKPNIKLSIIIAPI